jgi:hypothetical protein
VKVGTQCFDDRSGVRHAPIDATLDKMASVDGDASTPLLWEACVTATSGTTEDLVERAASAAVTFLDDLQAGGLLVNMETPPYGSLFGTAVLGSGFATGLTTLRHSTVMVRPTQPWHGPIERV